MITERSLLEMTSLATAAAPVTMTSNRYIVSFRSFSQCQTTHPPKGVGVEGYRQAGDGILILRLTAG